MEKDSTITDLLDWLREQLGNTFNVTDHWETDLCATGISALSDPAQLVYVCSYGRPAGRYYADLESAPLPGSDLPFRSLGEFKSLNREELLDVITKHLSGVQLTE